MKEIQKTETVEQAVQIAVVQFDKIESDYYELGKQWAESAKKFPNFIELLCEQRPCLTPIIVRRAIAAGEGKIHRSLLGYYPSAAVKYLEHLPLPIQEQYSNDRIPLLLANGDSIQALVTEMTPSQAKQVFAHDHIRSLSEQRLWLESRKTEMAMVKSAKPNEPYRLYKGALVVMAPATFSRADLIGILAKLEAK